MPQLSTLPESANSAPASSPTQTRLHGGWLVLARGAWLSVAAVGITISALSIPISYAQLEQVCTRAACLENEGLLRPQDLPTLEQWGLSPAFFAASATIVFVVVALVWIAMGVLLFWRRSAEPRALFFALFLVVVGTQLSGSPNVLVEAHPIWWLPVTALGFLQDTCFILFCYVFPTGRFVPRWTRWLALGWILADVGPYYFPRSPLSRVAWPAAAQVPFIVGILGFAIVAQIYRYRWRSTPVECQQTKWVVLALSTSVLLSLAWVPVFSLDAPHLVVVLTFGTTFILAVLLIPLAIAASILRYRLWEIDRLINTVLVYGLLTGLLAAVYAGLIIGLQALVSRITGQTGESPLVIVVSTLAIAALVRPLRRRVQSVIDRRFYRRKYDAEKTLATFSATLRTELDLNQLREQLLAVVQETMQPTQISLWLRQPSPQPWQPHAVGMPAPMLTPVPHAQAAGREPAARQQAPEGGHL